MPKTTKIKTVSSKRSKAVKAEMAKLKAQGKDVDMTLDEMRAAILELMEK